MSKVLTILLVIVAAILLLPMLGIGRLSAAPANVPQPKTETEKTGSKVRSVIGEITGTVATLIGAGKEIAGMFGSSKQPNDYQSQSGVINV